ncbi:IS3 family transposase [Clostridium saccharobutylicum]|nr:IS3 family transposase [Clostridium saccharobutylicum]
MQKFYTYEELIQAIDYYIVFYNTKRLQKNLKGLTPIEYRKQTLAS